MRRRQREVRAEPSALARPSAVYAVFAALAYIAADHFLTSDGVSVWFPPAALTLAYLVRVGWRGAPVALAVRLLVAALFMGPSFRLDNMVVTGLLVVAAYTAAAVWLRRRLDSTSRRLGAVGLTIAGAGGGALAAAVLAIGYLVLATPLGWSEFAPKTLSFWLGDMAAALTLAPPLLLGSSVLRRVRASGALGTAEIAVQLALVAATAWLAVGLDSNHPQFYLTFVPLLWVATRWGLGVTTLAMATTGVVVPLVDLWAGATATDMTKLQLFIVVYAVAGLVLGAGESDRRAARRTAETSTAALETEHRSLVLAEERFRLSFEAAPIGIALVATDGRFLRVNRALCAIVGYPARELVALTFQDITHPDDLDEDLGLVQDVLAGRVDGYTLDKRYIHRDGHVVPVQLDVSLVRSERGEPLHFISQIQDVSKRKAMLESLQAAEATQRACLGALEQGIALSTLEGEVLLLNPAGRAILGYDGAELTELFQSGRWLTYREDGTVLPPDERPVGHTMRTGENVAERVVAWRCADTSLVTLRVATEPVRDERGTLVGVVTAFTDITAQRALEQAEREAVARLEWQAFHDPLTGLPNRAMLLAELERRLADRRVAGVRALLYLDLDHFKLVNDTMGHAAGDELLVAVAARLQRAVRDTDLVARLGGDEFVVLADGLPDVAAAAALARRIADGLAEPVPLRMGSVEASASIGIAVDVEHTPDALLSDADTALYRAKQGGRGRFEVLSPPS